MEEENARLRARVAALEHELTALKAHAQAPVPKPEQSQTLGFLDLPAEIRNHVYELCLVPGEVLVRRGIDVHPPHVSTSRYGDLRFYAKAPNEIHEDQSLARKAHPKEAYLHVLLVCKQMYFEAVQLYLAKNHFIIFRGRRNHPRFVEPAMGYLGRRLAYGDLGLKYIRSISITFDCRDYEVDLDVDDTFYSDERIAAYLAGRPHWYTGFHVPATSTLLETWELLLEGIALLTLDFLQINLQNAYCPCRCERLVQVILDGAEAWPPESGRNGGILRCLADRTPPKVIEFLGTRNREERDAIRHFFLKDWCRKSGRADEYCPDGRLNTTQYKDPLPPVPRFYFKGAIVEMQGWQRQAKFWEPEEIVEDSEDEDDEKEELDLEHNAQADLAGHYTNEQSAGHDAVGMLDSDDEDWMMYRHDLSDSSETGELMDEEGMSDNGVEALGSEYDDDHDSNVADE